MLPSRLGMVADGLSSTDVMVVAVMCCHMSPMQKAQVRSVHSDVSCMFGLVSNGAGTTEAVVVAGHWPPRVVSTEGVGVYVACACGAAWHAGWLLVADATDASWVRGCVRHTHSRCCRVGCEPAM
jgi:hypothetical protein